MERDERHEGEPSPEDIPRKLKLQNQYQKPMNADPMAEADMRLCAIRHAQRSLRVSAENQDTPGFPPMPHPGNHRRRFKGGADHYPT
jgi:hypothetical protein